jgi:hypothetical protein
MASTTDNGAVEKGPVRWMETRYMGMGLIVGRATPRSVKDQKTTIKVHNFIFKMRHKTFIEFFDGVTCFS